MKKSKSELPYASNKEIADEKIGKWLSAALEDPTTCGAMKDDINEWFRAVEEERLRRIPQKKDSVEERRKTGNIFIDASNLVDKLTDEEIEELRAKKKAIKEELYDKVKMEMFKASSKLEGIDYEDQEVQCKSHPDAPHGFDRNSSLSLGRYVCECENWEPDWEPEPEDMLKKAIHDDSGEWKITPALLDTEVEGWDITKPAELKQLLQSMCDRMDRIEHGDDYFS